MNTVDELINQLEDEVDDLNYKIDDIHYMLTYPSDFIDYPFMERMEYRKLLYNQCIATIKQRDIIQERINLLKYSGEHK